MLDALRVEDRDLLVLGRIAELETEEESVELRLGERERALVFDRVLGGDHQERVGHRVGRPVDRRLMFLHAFEQSGLRLRRGPVDLIGQHDLAHDRAWPELELLGLLVVDGQARYVGREEVRRELDPAEGAAEAPGDRLGQDRLACSGNILDQHVAAAQQGDQGEANLVMLPDDDVLDVGDNLVAGLLDLGHRSHSCMARTSRNGTDASLGHDPG